MVKRAQMHGARYGEVFLVSGHRTHLEAAVYNTLGLNDCPDQLWRELDPAEIKTKHKVRAVILNGPRYFLMDATDISSAVESTPLTFGRLQMRRVATVHLPLASMLGGLTRQPYSQTTVIRSTVYTYNAGREVYELVSPEGTTYIMQSCSLQVDPTQSEASLTRLGARLTMPAGWHYRVRTLDQDLTLCVEGQAHVLQDEVENSYQRVASARTAHP